MFSKRTAAFVVAVLSTARVRSETHTVTFTNECGYGTPYLLAQNGDVLSTGEAYTVGGPLLNAIAFLQTGSCGSEGQDCSVVETNLTNGASNTYINTLPPYGSSGSIGFNYYNGCDGEGSGCTTSACPLSDPGMSSTPVPCTADNVDLAVTFCKDTVDYL